MQYNMVNLDNFSLTYQRSFQAQNGRLTFTAGGDLLQVNNLPESNVVVYQISGNGLMRLGDTEVLNAGSSFNASFAGMGNRRSIWLWE